ncbi:MAG: hypothetical protein ACR2P4_00020 [Gammaproteobacteria bacterium]
MAPKIVIEHGEKRKKSNSGSWIWSRRLNKLVPKTVQDNTDNDAPYIQKDIEAFISPIDKSLITSRSTLRQHHKRHGTTDARDYSPAYYAEKAKQRKIDSEGANSADRQERLNAIKASIERVQQRLKER